MYKDFFDRLFIRFHGDIEMMDVLQKTMGLDPNSFVEEMRDWIHKKCISCRICPDCLTNLRFGYPSVEHIVTLECPKCGMIHNFF
jgi:hypothetical protein